LAAGLCPDPLGELTALRQSTRLCSWTKRWDDREGGKWEQMWEGEEEGKVTEKGNKG